MSKPYDPSPLTQAIVANIVSMAPEKRKRIEAIYNDIRNMYEKEPEETILAIAWIGSVLQDL